MEPVYRTYKGHLRPEITREEANNDLLFSNCPLLPMLSRIIFVKYTLYKEHTGEYHIRECHKWGIYRRKKKIKGCFTMVLFWHIQTLGYGELFPYLCLRARIVNKSA